MRLHGDYYLCRAAWSQRRMGKTLGNAWTIPPIRKGNSAMVNETLPQGASPSARQAWSVLIVSTFAFTVCFMVWMMFGVIGIPIRRC